MTSIVSMLKQILHYGLTFAARTITSILDLVFPKDNRTIIFGSDFTNRMSGDPKALFENIRENHPSYSAYFIVKNPSEKGQIEPNTLRTLLIFLKARFAFTSHGISDFGLFKWSRRKIVISTGHGLNLKSSGYAQRNRTFLMKYDVEQYTKSVTAAIASSKYSAAIRCLTLGFGGRIFPTGHPKNDILVNNISTEKEKLRKIFPDISEDDKILLYAPTFRSTVKKSLSTGSMLFPTARIVQTPIRLFPFDDFNIETFYEFLRNHNIVVLLRLHIGDTATDPRLANLDRYSDRIKWFNYQLCPDVNSILSETDIVITDYSSIFYDFLLLDRPVMFIAYDLEDYKKKRGIVVDNYDLATPGPKVSTMNEFIDYVSIYSRGEIDPYQQQRIDVNSMVNASQTADSSGKILKMLKILHNGNY